MRSLLTIGLLCLGWPWWPATNQAPASRGVRAAPEVQSPPGGQGEVPSDRPFDGNVMAAKLTEELRGVWQLESAEFAGTRSRAPSTSGYMIVEETTLALEMHVHNPNHLRSTYGLFFQTGFFRWRITPGVRLEAVSLIGTSNMTEDERVEYEPPGTRRDFAVQLTGDRLTLTKSDRTTFVWRRVPKLPFPRDDSPGAKPVPQPGQAPAPTPSPR